MFIFLFQIHEREVRLRNQLDRLGLWRGGGEFLRLPRQSGSAQTQVLHDAGKPVAHFRR